MALPMTQNSTWACAHPPGTGTITTVSGILSVNSDPVVTLTEALTMTITGCTNIGSGLTPCSSLVSATPGATKLTKGGAVVALDSTVYTTDSVPTSVLSVVSAQSKLTAI
jgi:hypothetical protein